MISTDVKFNKNSVTFWIRSPKIERQKLGDIVEASLPLYAYMHING